MEKRKIEEWLKEIGNDNLNYEILLTRIDILNRIIKEMKKNEEDCLSLRLSIEDSDDKNKEIEKLQSEVKEKSEEINRLNNTIDVYKKEKENYAKENTLYKEKMVEYEKECQKKQMNIETLNSEVIELKKKVKILKEKEELYSKIDEAYNAYCGLEDEIKEMFSGFIFTDNLEVFTASVSSEQKLNRFYKKINDYVMRNQDKIIENHGFLKQQRLLAKIFDFYYECLIGIDKNTNYERINAQIGKEYDDELYTRIGTPCGLIEDVLVQGYTVDDELRNRSIVLVRE